jgi:predicted Zn-dependent protease
MLLRLLAVVLVFLTGVQPGSPSGLKALTTPQELALGQSFAEAVDRQFPLLRDPILKWYVNLRGRQLADLSARNNIPYFFRIIDSSEINAFAIPGGHIYLNLGVLQIADNEAEALGILAHEVGHIVGRHGAKQIIRQQWASIALSGAIYKYPNYYAYLAGNLFGGLGFLKLSREAEKEADELGFQILMQLGYDPEAMVTMFQKLQERHKREPGRLEKLFLTHPPTNERIEDLKVLLAGVQKPDGLKLGSAEWDEVKSRVTQLYPAPQPEEDKKEEKKKGEREEAR